jgi:hypothetical protein
MHVLSIRYEVELLFDHYGTIGWTQLPYVIAGSPKQKERERSQRLFNERRGFREHVRQADRKGWRGASEARRKTKKEIVAVVWGGSIVTPTTAVVWDIPGHRKALQGQEKRADRRRDSGAGVVEKRRVRRRADADFEESNIRIDFRKGCKRERRKRTVEAWMSSEQGEP